MSDDKTLGRIASLLHKAESTDNEHEADAFLQGAQRLATLHSIDLAVAREHAGGRQRRSTPVQRQVVLGEPGKRGLRTYVELFLAIARANEVPCDIARNSSYVIAYGFPDDLAAVETLYASLVVQMVRAADAYLATGRHRVEGVGGTTARISFHEAFAERIGERLAAAARAARAAAVAADAAARAEAGTTPTSDEPVGTELVLVRKAAQVRDFHRENSTARGTWRGNRRQGDISLDALHAGAAAGDRARLGGEAELGTRRRAIGE